MYKEVFEDAPDLNDIAVELIGSLDIVSHIEIDEVLFFREVETSPSALAKCFSFNAHPVIFFTDKKYAIVVYQQNIDYMDGNQLKMLVLHELMHIPVLGDKLIDHDVKDFQSLLNIDANWTKPGAKVPDMIGSA